MARPTSRGAPMLTGVVIGAVVTLLATLAIVPTDSETTAGGLPRVLAAGALAPGEQAVQQADGAIAIVDSQGRVVRTVAGQASTDASGGTGGTEGGTGGTSGGGSSAIGTSGGGSGAGGLTANPDGSPIECAAGKNGGSTSVGVTGTEITLGATVAESGIAQSFLGEVRQGMEAVRNNVNNAGGICGRSLTVIYKDDGWSADTGTRYLQNLVEDSKVFALAVAPSSEGVNAASSQTPSYFVKTGVPVVGSDGMIRSQYKDPMIWPVAASTTTVMHAMMQEAWDRGARHPAIVFENTYRFGVEGAYAFNAAYKRLDPQHRDIDGYTNPLTGGAATCAGHFCGIAAEQGQYQGESATLKDGCGNPHVQPSGAVVYDDPSKACDFVAILLEPKTAADWMKSPGVLTSRVVPKGLGAAQPLFTYDFGNACGPNCDQMRVWTGYNPPVGAFASSPAVTDFVALLHGQSSTADEFNQFTEGGFLGMKLLVEALTRAGPNLTRGALTAALDSMPAFDTGLAPALTWRPGAHFANGSAQSFTMLSANGFGGWQQATGYIADPWLGQDIG